MNKLFNLLEKEVCLITDPVLKDFAEKYLKSKEDWLSIKPAATSGKYHNIQDIAEGGLVHHTRAVVKTLEIFFSTLEEFDNKENRDLLICAALFHDLAKFLEKEQLRTNSAHPMDSAIMINNFFEKYRKEYPEQVSETLENQILKIVSLIETHHGRWDKDNVTGTLFPKIEGLHAYLLHWSDMIASRSFVTVDLDN